MNKTNKILILLYVIISGLIFSVLISIDSNLERPTRPLNLVPKPLSQISIVKTVDVEKKTIFDTFQDIQNYPYVLPNNVLKVKNLGNSTYQISLIEKGIQTTLKINHTSIPYDKQIFRVIDGDAQGTTIIQTFETDGTGTKISVNIDLKTRGLLTPFSFLPIVNVNHAVDTVLTKFVDYAKRPYTDDEKIIDNLYRTILQRPADPQGLKYYSEQLNHKSLDEIRNELKMSTEYESLMLLNNLKEINELNDTTKESINDLYNTILRRDADAGGLTYFGTALELGKMNLSDIRDSLLTSDEFNSLPVETRDSLETYKTNEYWQIVNQTYYDIYEKYPSKKIIRSYGIFYEKGELSIEEMKKLFSDLQ